jgi:hypothetical protein
MPGDRTDERKLSRRLVYDAARKERGLAGNVRERVDGLQRKITGVNVTRFFERVETLVNPQKLPRRHVPRQSGMQRVRIPDVPPMRKVIRTKDRLAGRSEKRKAAA